MAGPVAHLGLLGISIAGIINAFLTALTSWVGAGAAAVVSAVSGAISETTTPSLGAGFSLEVGVLEHFGASLAAGFLALCLIQAVIAQDLSLVVRAVLLKLPLALLGSAVALECVTLALGASDSCAHALLAAAGGPAGQFLSGYAKILVVTGLAGLPPGFEGFLLAAVAAVVAFVLWVELLIRSAAISVAALFIPLALAGVLWPATAHWARRLGETIAALILSKVVIAGVLALATATVFVDGGAAGIVEGTALFLFATLSPFAVLRLVPMIEQGAALSLEEAAHAAARQGRRVAGALSLVGGPGAGAAVAGGAEGVDFFAGDDLGLAEYGSAPAGSTSAGPGAPPSGGPPAALLGPLADAPPIDGSAPRGLPPGGEAFPPDGEEEG